MCVPERPSRSRTANSRNVRGRGCRARAGGSESFDARTATGAITGGSVGGTLGLLAGIGTLAIPGVGAFIAAGPIMAALAGVGIGGTVGGLVGALVGMGVPEYEAKRYEGRVKGGGVLLSVHCDTAEEIARAKDVLTRTRAEDVSSTGEAASDDRHEPRDPALLGVH